MKPAVVITTAAATLLLYYITTRATSGASITGPLWVPVKLRMSDNVNYATQYPQYRGIRNNNPGNIRHGDNWLGRADSQPDQAFITFESPEYGVRAMARILRNYQTKYGLSTVRGLISRWAPPIENNTGAYVDHVAHMLGVGADEQIIVAGHLGKLIPAIIRHENGIQPYPDTVIADGIEMA